MPPHDLAGISPDARLLLACIRGHFSQAARDDVREACEQPIDWDGVRRLAARHRVLPLLADACGLGRVAPLSAPLPPTLIEALDQARRLNAARNLRAAAWGNAILHRLDAAGIRALGFKGPTLAMQAYGSLALRTFDDVDVLVAPGDRERALALITASGFAPSVPLTARHHEALASQGRAVTFVHARDQVAIDVHSAITPGYQPLRIDTCRLIDEGVFVDVLGQRVRTLPPEMLFVLLCAHGAKHMWERLVWVADIAALLQGSRLDWGRVEQLAGAWRCNRALRVACSLAARLLHAEIPGALAGVRERRIDSLVDQAVDRLSRAADVAVPTLALARFHLGTMDGWVDRGRYVGAMLQPSEADWAETTLPGALGALHYPRRVYRLLVGSAPGVPSRRA